jgi:hypothetical protein
LVSGGQIFLQDCCERIYITHGEYKAILTWPNQILVSANVVAQSRGTAAKHGLVYYNSERFILGGQDHQVGGGINLGELRLIYEPKESHLASQS